MWLAASRGLQLDGTAIAPVLLPSPPTVIRPDTHPAYPLSTPGEGHPLAMPSVHFRGRRVAAILALGLLPSLLVAVPGSASPASAPVAEGVVAGADSPDAVPGRYIVTLKAGVTGLGATAQGMVAGRVTGGGTTSAFTANLSAQDARRLAADPSVGIVEQDRIVRVEATQKNPVWGLDRIDQRSIKGSKSYTPMDDGSSVHAYIIDTGIRIGNKQFGGRASYGYDFADGDTAANDCDGHGTHVAGTVGGATYGVAKRVKLVAVRVLDCTGAGLLSDVIDGVNWVTANAVKPAVANMSLGSGYSASLEYAVQTGIDSGITYVVAAGNSNANSYYFSPAGLPAAITVAASDVRDRRRRSPTGVRRWTCSRRAWASSRRTRAVPRRPRSSAAPRWPRRT